MSESQERRYTVTGMSCGHCEAAVTEEVSAVAGVESVTVSLEDGVVTVTGRGLSDDAIVAAVEEAGYSVGG
ncbi:MAG TPA: heavy-metal-associated domain-containing protein [Miltoncostaeaceae bacterium]|nr:heavy-metal-associated domain-containing protein [Miltoncostaeaceae bacterium]